MKVIVVMKAADAVVHTQMYLKDTISILLRSALKRSAKTTTNIAQEAVAKGVNDEPIPIARYYRCCSL